MAADGIHEMLVTDDSIRMPSPGPSASPAGVPGPFSSITSSGVLHGEQLPPVRNALELVHASVGKADPRAQHQHLHRAGDQDLVRLSEASDARADVNGKTGCRYAPALYFPGVQAGADFDADIPHRVPHGAGAPDGPGRPVKSGE